MRGKSIHPAPTFNFGELPILAGQGKYLGLTITVNPRIKDQIKIESKRQNISFRFAAFVSKRGKFAVKNISSKLYLTKWTVAEEKLMQRLAEKYFQEKFKK
ncbi:MAG: hypothetical protein ABIJ91_04245 [Candidatus Kuenenbacteria bacterium]